MIYKIVIKRKIFTNFCVLKWVITDAVIVIIMRAPSSKYTRTDPTVGEGASSKTE